MRTISTHVLHEINIDNQLMTENNSIIIQVGKLSTMQQTIFVVESNKHLDLNQQFQPYNAVRNATMQDLRKNRYYKEHIPTINISLSG